MLIVFVVRHLIKSLISRNGGNVLTPIIGEVIIYKRNVHTA